MIERLEYIRLAPRRMLDIGCGRGHSRAPLRLRFPEAQWFGVDISERMLGADASAPNRAWRWRSEPSNKVVGDGGQLPLAGDSVDLLFSNLMLHWHPEPHRLFPEWKRVLSSDGLLMFSCFGPDTIKELRAAARVAMPWARAMPFIDMHDFGDMLVASGFDAPVMDAEIITLTYGSPRDLLRDVRAFGGNPRDDRGAGLPSSRQAHRLLDLIEAQRGGEGRIRLTFEVAYGHAWKPQPKTSADIKISVDSIRAQLADRRRP